MIIKPKIKEILCFNTCVFETPSEKIWFVKRVDGRDQKFLKLFKEK